MTTNERCPLTISKKQLVNTDLVLGLGGGAIIFLFSMWYIYGTRHSLVEVSCFSAAVVFFFWFGLRRFLRSITFDPERESLTARSIIPGSTYSISLSDVQMIRCKKVATLDRSGFNLGLKRKGVIQPLVFEVWTAEEAQEVWSLMSLLSSYWLVGGWECVASGRTQSAAFFFENGSVTIFNLPLLSTGERVDGVWRVDSGRLIITTTQDSSEMNLQPTAIYEVAEIGSKRLRLRYRERYSTLNAKSMSEIHLERAV